MSIEAIVSVYGRVWAGGQSEGEHRRFHLALWGPEGGTRPGAGEVCVAILTRIAALPSSEEDRCLVSRHLGEDWEQARVVATLASSCHCR